MDCNRTEIHLRLPKTIKYNFKLYSYKIKFHFVADQHHQNQTYSDLANSDLSCLWSCVYSTYIILLILLVKWMFIKRKVSSRSWFHCEILSLKTSKNWIFAFRNFRNFLGGGAPKNLFKTRIKLMKNWSFRVGIFLLKVLISRFLAFYWKWMLSSNHS